MTLKMFLKGLKENRHKSLDYLLKELLLVKKTQDKRYKGFKNNTFTTENIRSIFSLHSCFELYKNRMPKSVQTLLAPLSIRFQNSFDSSEYYSNLKDTNIRNFWDFVFNISCLVKSNAFMSHLHTNCMCDSEYHDDDCLSSIGCMLGASMSLVNHSCVPNADVICKNGNMILVAMRPITQNEQIFVSYGPKCTDIVAERIKLISSTYRFTCDCPACREQWNLTPVSLERPNLTFIRYFGKLILKLHPICHDLGKNMTLLRDVNLKDLIDKLNLRLNKIYNKESLLKVSELLPLFQYYVPYLYEIYYATNLFMPEDLENEG